MERRHFLGGVAASLAPAFVRAQGSLEKFKFNLGWKVEATAAGFVLAQQRGYYKDAGLDVAIDTGSGSSAVGLVASGAYDCLSADLGTMLEFRANNPGADLKAVAIQYDANPNAIIVRKDGPVAKPADLAGKDLLGQPFNASRKLFPIFAKAQGIDPATVRWESIAPDIGDTRFVQGDFDGVGYFFFTGLLNLQARGMNADKLRVFRFSELGVKSYGNGLVVNRQAMARADVLRAFVKATIRGWIEVMADPKAGAAAVKAREPLANEDIEYERLKLILDGTMRTPFTRSSGWGAAEAGRLQATIDETNQAFGLKSVPTVADIWTDAFLPALKDRRLPG